VPIQLGSLERAKLPLAQGFKLDLSNGPNGVDASPPFHLRAETNPVSDTVRSVRYTRQWTEIQRTFKIPEHPLHCDVCPRCSLLSPSQSICFPRSCRVRRVSRSGDSVQATIITCS
jgi:hypothetical protein